MNVLSLCTGIGGLDLGIKLAWPEARTVGCCEIDAYCRAVLLARMAEGRFDPCPIWDDLRLFDGKPWRGAVDTIAAGFPCQDISNAGRREGIREGNRSGLWYEIERIIGEVGPRYVFVENVGALLVRGVGIVLGGLSDLGYDACWGIVSAADVGAPHLRKRLFILAHSHGARGGDPQPIGQRWPAAESGSDGSPLAHAQRPERGPDALPGGRGGEGSDEEGQAAGGTRERGFTLAHAEGGSEERPAGQRSPAWAGAGRGSGALADAEGERRELRPAAGGRPGRPAGGSGEPVADAALRDGLDLRGERREPGGAGSRGSEYVSEAGGFPPGPGDAAGWRERLAHSPWLRPAVAEGEAEQLFRGVPHGFPFWVDRRRAKDRVARLRALGNAVCPAQAAAAFTELLRRVEQR